MNAHAELSRQMRSLDTEAGGPARPSRPPLPPQRHRRASRDDVGRTPPLEATGVLEISVLVGVGGRHRQPRRATRRDL